MQIDLNGARIDTAAPDLNSLLAEHGFDAASCATALNGDFVPRGLRAETALNPDDRVEVLAPMQGG